MKSFLISALMFRFNSTDADSFNVTHPYDWLLWEPGAWKPPGSTTLVQGDTPTNGATPAPGRAGEALAMALEPKKGTKQITLGRGDECDAVINDGTLSQLHLVFMLGDGKWTVRDAGSRNGSTVDGHKLVAGKPVELKSGAKIVAAQVAFTYYTPAGMLERLRRS